jgi:hypothetical protein
MADVNVNRASEIPEIGTVDERFQKATREELLLCSGERSSG